MFWDVAAVWGQSSADVLGRPGQILDLVAGVLSGCNLSAVLDEVLGRPGQIVDLADSGVDSFERDFAPEG